uniref:Putative galactokinase n=1 Tax=Panstrongylus lignarius TaxID=156445 RepID=A0A224XC78_9HEMI
MSMFRKVSLKDMLHYAIDYYTFLYSDDNIAPHICVYSPASAYIFGEHSDYNRSFAMSMTLPMTVMVIVGFNNRKVINIATDGACGRKLVERYPLKGFEDCIKDAPCWVQMTLWTLCAFKDKLEEGVNIAYVSSIPIGIGLGSSTALTTAMFTAVEALIDKHYLRLRPKVKLCIDIETYGLNTLCGCAQQMTVFCAEKGYALMMDCRTLIASYIPIQKWPVVFIITYSDKERLIKETRFKERIEECKKAAYMLGLTTLGEATSSLLCAMRGAIDETLFKRATHVVEEELRMFDAARALKRGDYGAFGLMMLQSHYSLKDNFEVSTKEIDELVNFSMACPGVYGSKLTGIGFGGCTLTLVHCDYVEEFKEMMDTNYCGGECKFMIAKSWGSLKVISFEMRNSLFKKNIYPESAFKFGEVQDGKTKPSQRFMSMYLNDESLVEFGRAKKYLKPKKKRKTRRTK